MQNPELRFCHRIEQRTVIPGRPDVHGNPQTQCFIIVDSKERYYGLGGELFTAVSHMRPSDFFPSTIGAEVIAKKLHSDSGCEEKGCGYTTVYNRFEDDLPF